MAVIKTEGGYNALPISYKRGNPIPLDKTEIWYDYNLMAEYAASNPVAYVGQILGLVDQTNNTATAYIILNTAGDLQEVGGAIAVDDTSLSLNEEGTIALKYWGIQYYKYIPASIDSETGEEIAANYKLQLVDDNNPWIAGLEPKVALEDGTLVLAWYEPNPTTIEGLGSTVGTLQTTVDDLSETTTELQNDVTSIKEEIGKIGDDTNPATGLYAELDRKADKEEVLQQIAAADHLKRKKVANITEAEEYIAINDDADQYIYMVPTGLQYDDDKYDEYMVIDEVLEKVGSWEVDLTKYVTNETLETELDKKINAQEGYSLVSNEEIEKLTTVARNAEENYIKSVDSHFTVSETKQLQLNSLQISDVANLESVLSEKVNKVYYTVTDENGSTQQVEGALLSPTDKDKLEALVIGDSGGIEISGKVNASNVEGLSEWITQNKDTISGLFSTSEAKKLESIQEGAEVNFIKSVNTEEFIVNDVGKLSLVNPPLFTDISTDFTINEESKMLSLTDSYVTTSIYASEVGDLSKLIRATEKENSTLVDEINYINNRLQWGELSNS